MIPNQKFLDELESNKRGLPRPLLALLQAYIKMTVFDALQGSTLIDDDRLLSMYERYFPEKIQKEFKKELVGHYLQKEILATVICNKVINQAGILFFDDIQKSTGLGLDLITIAYLVFDHALEGSK